jgi:flagellin
MTGIVLSASVRQNLLSLQSTASLLATTQNDLATGNKVNSALDNPTSFFTASALNNRASDISNLLDGIGNGVQVLQAANTGITSLQSLVASAQSVANQVLQTPIGYDSKSSIVSSAITGATANNLLGTGTPATSGSLTAGAFTTLDLAPASAATAAAPITGGAFTAVDLSSGSVTFTLNVDGATTNVDLNAAAVTAFTTAGGTLTGSASALTAADVAGIIDFQVGGTTTGAGPVTVSGGKLLIQSPTTGTGSHLAITSFTSAPNAGSTGLAAVALETGAAAGATAAQSQVFTVTVDGGTAKTITLDAAHVTAYNTANGTTLSSTSLSAANVASLINYQYDNTGATTVASVSGGNLVFTSNSTGTSSNVVTSAVTGTATSGTTGIASATGTAGLAAKNALQGEILKIGATGTGTASTITFGTASGQISTLNDLNTALASDNLQATISTTGVLTITTSNNAASTKLGGTVGISGSATTGVGIFSGATVSTAVADPDAQATRSGLIDQYNNILKQIDTTSQDSSFNGINLLQGDTLNLTFDETGKSTLAIKGVTFNTAGLGLSTLTAGTDFLDSNSANTVLASLTQVSTTLRSEASNLGSNLSIVQIRQDFSKNLINVLQTGASNLTLADTNEEAANSQALSTRQSIAVSALALANQSQQSVLQLLR